MTSRSVPAGGAQALSWNAAGRLTQVSGGTGGTTAYPYAADGSLLLQANPGSSTLYLDGEQLTATTSGGTTTVTGARIIALPSGGDVVRTGGTASYSFEVPDPHGTNDLSLDSTAQAPAWRQFTPYGAPRGATTAWVDNRGFLNKPNDPATGLTYVGARAYDPFTGQFTSPDPVLVPGDPQDLNAYAYGKGNPVLRADPTGLYVPNDPTSTEDPVQQFREDNPTRSAGGSGTITLPGGNHFAGGGSSGKTSPGRALQPPPDCTWGMLPVFACARTTGNPRHTAQSTGNGFNWDTGAPAGCPSMFIGFLPVACPVPSSPASRSTPATKAVKAAAATKETARLESATAKAATRAASLGWALTLSLHATSQRPSRTILREGALLRVFPGGRRPGTSKT